jgi:putative glycosyltransferase (TIGR04348 family)
MVSAKPVVCIVTPGTRSANNGNWRTAARWAGMLRDRYRLIVQTQWDGEPANLMVALHAKRSAPSIEAYRSRHPSAPLLVVLTGTDLYRDLPSGPEVARSLDLADRIIVLQDDALRLLEGRWRRKAEVVFQSARTLPARTKPKARLHCVAVGHLRPEKDPATLFSAVEEIPAGLPITFRHIGAPLDLDLARAARALERRDARYRYSGALSHGIVRSSIAAAHLLIHPSIMEGGANVIVEAVTAGTPVLASRMSGNVGMLGDDYPGYFAVGNAPELAKCLVRALEDPGYLRSLGVACARRRSLFTQAAERRHIRDLTARLLAQASR